VERNEVNEAFEILLEEIEAVVNALNETGAEVLRQGEYDKARQAIEEATRLAEFREKVRSLQKEWNDLLSAGVAEKRKRGKRKVKGPLRRGLRTPEDAFRRPILEALAELGGSAPMREVLALVEKKMSGVLNEYDYQPLQTGEIRWRNTAQWCRNTLVREGLLRSDSPKGIWEIAASGWLELENSGSAEDGQQG